MLFAVYDVFYKRVSEKAFLWKDFGFNSPLTASLLLLLPAVIITIVTQREGNRFASRCFALSKAMLSASAAATFVAALMLSLNTPPHLQQQFGIMASGSRWWCDSLDYWFNHSHVGVKWIPFMAPAAKADET